MAARKRAKQNSLLQAAKRVNFEGNFAEALAQDVDEVWEAWLKHCRNYQKHCMYMLYDVYGYHEMRCHEMKEECIQEMQLMAVQAVRNFVYDESITELKNMRRLYAYAHILIKNAMRRIIEAENGSKSKYFSWYLLHMKKKGLDLWHSPDDLLYESIMECRPDCKNPSRQLEKIRKYYLEINKKVSLEEAESQIAKIRYDVIDGVDFKVSLQAFHKAVGNETYQVFYDYFVDRQQKWTFSSLAIKYGTTPYEIQKRVKSAKAYAKQFFTEECSGLLLPNVINRPENKNYSDEHNGLSLEELVDICEKE